MSLDQPRALLLAALARKSSRKRLELHALLDRVAARHVIPISNCLREPVWDEWAAVLDYQLSHLLDQLDWSERVAQQIRLTPERHEDRLLVFSATLLQALDRFHRCHLQEVTAAQIKLPPEIGSGRTLFLPPPKTPIEDLIPEKRRLGRSLGHLENNHRTELHLWWILIHLEGQAVQPELQSLDPFLSQELERRLSGSRDLRIGVSSPFTQLDYEIQGDGQRCHSTRGTPYRFVGLKQACLREARETLAEILETCQRERIDLLCFPELTLDTTLLQHLSLLLKTRNTTLHPVLVMAGSFHVDAGLARANRCSILDGFGKLLFFQDKCTAYSIPPKQARLWRPEMRDKLGIDERGGYEDIDSGTSLRLTDLSLGRLATPICLDFCGNQIRELMVQSQVNLLLVPAMTPRMGPFYSRARDLGTSNRATSVVVNSAWLLRQLGLRSRRQRALGYLPGRKGLRGGGRLLSEHLALFTIREVLDLP